MNEIHRSKTRGLTNNCWLSSHHSFSFSDYYNPNRLGFGKLRVLNDDWINPKKGFDQHPHSNMEIISIPLSGSLLHKDSFGNHQIIKENEIQIMSAGDGIKHSEYNHSTDKSANFLQIWISPKKSNLAPRYEQKPYSTKKLKHSFYPIVSSRVEDTDAVWINQDAIFSLALLDKDEVTCYTANFKKPAIYLFVIEGEIEVNAETLYSRDAIALNHIKPIQVIAKQSAKLLCIETTQ